MRLVNSSNVLYNNLKIAQKEKEVKQFKFILHNNNIKIAILLNYKNLTI
jgi:hypothetical protein